MDDLIDFSLKEPPKIARLRALVKSAQDDDAVIALGVGLAKVGCSHEAAILLRPKRAKWKDHPDVAVCTAALQVQTWYNKNWKQFAGLKQAGDIDAALRMLDGRAKHFWDHPPILMHLGGFAVDRSKLDLAEHIFQRIGYLAERGVPKINMTAFVYGAQAALLDVLSLRGKSKTALSLWRKLEHNPGNAMARQLQGARLMTAAGESREALRQVADIIVTAEQGRRRYGRDVRLDFVENSPDLAALRKHKDWATMRSNPVGYVAST
ncbi:MAG: hypothetical protein AAF557_15200 [Pseudomonadota bacterium]